MVPGAGIEPARPRRRRILSPVCLPISPPGQKIVKLKVLDTLKKIKIIHRGIGKMPLFLRFKKILWELLN